MDRFFAKIDANGFNFGPKRKEWLEYARKNVGQVVELKPRSRITREARGYFEGALVPAYCDWCENYDVDNSKHQEVVRDLFKREFNSEMVPNLHGGLDKIAKSTTTMDRVEFREVFIQKIVEYFEEHEIPIPDPKLFKDWQERYSLYAPELNYYQWLLKNNLNFDGSPRELKT